jgi:hypothetical protein
MRANNKFGPGGLRVARNAKSRNLLLGAYLGCGLLILLLGVPVAAGWYMWCDWVPQSTIDRLPAASKAEVRELLGEASEESPREGYERWFYRRPFRIAEFRVDFDDSGRVEYWSYDR